MTRIVDPDLHAAMLAAHAAGDLKALTRLYAAAADRTGDPDEAAFFLTQAYVFALDAGAPEADDLHARLKAIGRDD